MNHDHSSSEQVRFYPGDRVRVARGPLVGAEGAVRKRCAVGRVVVAIRIAQVGVTLEIDECYLEADG